MTMNGAPLDAAGSPPGGFGGPPPGGGYGPPPGGFGGPPPGGGYGPPPGGGYGPPPGGGYGPPPGGGYGPPPGYGAPPPQKKGPNLGLIIGLGCGGLFFIGLIVTGILVYLGSRTAEEISSVPTASPAPSPTQGGLPLPSDGNLKVELRDLREFKSALGTTKHFVAELHNTGSAPVSFPKAKVVFYDAADTAVDDGLCLSVVRVLPPGEKVPCTFVLTGKKTFVSHKVEITPTKAFFTGQIAKLDITDVKFVPKTRRFGAFEVEGKITNKSPFTAKNAMAIVTLYDKAGKVVGASQTPVAGNSLDTGASAQFSAKIFDVADTPNTWQVLAVGYSE
jgi:hypothetical protein